MSISDGSTQIMMMTICTSKTLTVFQTSAQKAGGHHLAMSLLDAASIGSSTRCRLLLAAGGEVEERETNTLFTRVSHLQFYLISLLFQAGIYARHTKEQE